MRVCEHLSQLVLLTGEANLKFEPGSRIILDAILLTVAEIVADGEAKMPVAILPKRILLWYLQGLQVERHSRSQFSLTYLGALEYYLGHVIDIKA